MAKSRKDAWIIYDGAIPANKPRCKIVVITSPGNLSKNVSGAKAFTESTPFDIYFPPWSYEECKTAAEHIYKVDHSATDKIRERYVRYGGIARFVLEWQSSKPTVNPLGNSLASADIVKAVNDLGSAEFDHNAVSGKIIHLIPSPDLREYTYEWASTYVMELAFERLFDVCKGPKIQCLLNAGQGLTMGTLYGILFEPWFHRKITQQGLRAKARPLETEGAKTRKRKVFGIGSDEEVIVKWPAQKVHRFFDYPEIIVDKYNIPQVANFPAVDSLAPSRGELFQITVAESHEIKASIS
jgi:hypothetical protein